MSYSNERAWDFAFSSLGDKELRNPFAEGMTLQETKVALLDTFETIKGQKLTGDEIGVLMDVATDLREGAVTLPNTMSGFVRLLRRAYYPEREKEYKIAHYLISLIHAFEEGIRRGQSAVDASTKSVLVVAGLAWQSRLELLLNGVTDESWRTIDLFFGSPSGAFSTVVQMYKSEELNGVHLVVVPSTVARLKGVKGFSSFIDVLSKLSRHALVICVDVASGEHLPSLDLDRFHSFRELFNDVNDEAEALFYYMSRKSLADDKFRDLLETMRYLHPNLNVRKTLSSKA